LISKREIKKETIDDVNNSKSTRKRKRGAYITCFAPHFWPSILATVKKHGDLTGALHYLKTFHRKPKEVSGPYEKLSKGYLYEWFTPRRKLKPHVKVVIKKRTTSTTAKKHFSIFETRLKLKDELITLLKNMRVVGHGLSTPILQPIIRRIFENRAPKMDKRFHEVSLELVLPNNYNSNKETTINMGSRRDIHGTSSCLPCQNVHHTSMLGC